MPGKPSARAEAVTRRTYNRPFDDEGRQLETWDQTSRRATVDHHQWLWEQAGGKPDMQELEELRQLVYQRKSLVAGRTLWLGGTKYGRERACSQFNCFGGETLVLTRQQGLIPLRDTVGEAEVYTSQGWQPATISAYGEQELVTLEFSYHSHKTYVRATLDHTWVLSDGSRVPTCLLRQGDRIPFNPPARCITNREEYDRGVAHGFVYGDGTKTSYGGFVLYQYGDHEDVETLLGRFNPTRPESTPDALRIGIPKSLAWCDLKALPGDGVSLDYLLGFIRGWLAADGSVSKSGQTSICVGPAEERWLVRQGARLGYFFAGSTDLSAVTNYGPRNKASRTLRFFKSCITPADLLIRRKAERVATTEMEYSFRGPVPEEGISRETVYCAQVPTTRDFTIAGGMLTGNCSYTRAQTVYQFVDAFWLLLNGCGLGFRPQAGTLHGFLRPIPELEIIESTRSPDDRGPDVNEEVQPCADNDYHWVIVVGDSAEGWAKAIGKLINPPRTRVNKLTVDFSNCRGPGKRLKGYGWICNGSGPLSKAVRAIFDILNAKAGDLLDEIDLLDVMNWLGTVLSSRRSAQLAEMDYGHPRWEQFARAKKDWFLYDQAHRQQSNNSLVFWWKPTRAQIRQIMELIWECGGSEPGFINGEAARRRAPWFDGLNPCAEILLSSNGFCNLVTTAVCKFKNNFHALLRALYVMGRANYRQTCVDLRDGVLSPEWHQTNEALRLCGMSLTGIAQAPWLTDYQIKQMRNAAVTGCYSMADQLGLPRPKLVTTIKPEGTGSKIMDVSEGLHRPLGRFIFNWIGFSHMDPLIEILERAGYRVMEKPDDPTSMLICFPVDYTGCRFESVDGKQVVQESAVKQLERYRHWNTLWTDHNSSVTISWDISEIDEIVDWLYKYWDNFVAVSWMSRIDPTKTPEDAGYKYLPQEVVTKEAYEEYVVGLKEVEWQHLHQGVHELDLDDCAGGVCPVK